MVYGGVAPPVVLSLGFWWGVLLQLGYGIVIGVWCHHLDVPSLLECGVVLGMWHFCWGVTCWSAVLAPHSDMDNGVFYKGFWSWGSFVLFYVLVESC